MDCSIQSPNEKDVTVNILGMKELVVKRYITRTIRESYALLMKAHPDIKLGLTKFYARLDDDGCCIKREDFIMSHAAAQPSCHTL